MALELRLVVVGSGRSGTGTAARLLTTLGYPTGHESVLDWTLASTITRRLDYAGRTPSPHEAGDPTLVAEATLASLDHLDDLADAGVAIWHLARHPFDVIDSWTNTGFMDDTTTPYFRMMARHFPDLDVETHAADRAAVWVAGSNLALHHHRTHFRKYHLTRLEDLAATRPILEELLGDPIDRSAYAHAVRTIGHANAHPRTRIGVPYLEPRSLLAVASWADVANYNLVIDLTQ